MLHNSSHSRQAGGEERVRERWRGEEGRGEEAEERKREEEGRQRRRGWIGGQSTNKTYQLYDRFTEAHKLSKAPILPS